MRPPDGSIGPTILDEPVTAADGMEAIASTRDMGEAGYLDSAL